MDSIYNNSILPNQVLLLVDGLLNDKFLNKINKYRDTKKFDMYMPGKRIGLSKILNEGIKLSKNDWIIRADGDDINLPSRFEILLKSINDDTDLIGSYVNEYNPLTQENLIKKLPVETHEIKKYIKFRNPFNHMSVAFKKKSVMEVGLYPHLYLKEDYGLWIKLISKDYNCINISNILVNVSADDNMYKRRSGWDYLVSEFSLYKFKIKFKVTNLFEAQFYLFLRLAFFIIPNFLKIFIYKKVLRKLLN